EPILRVGLLPARRAARGDRQCATECRRLRRGRPPRPRQLQEVARRVCGALPEGGESDEGDYPRLPAVRDEDEEWQVALVPGRPRGGAETVVRGPRSRQDGLRPGRRLAGARSQDPHLGGEQDVEESLGRLPRPGPEDSAGGLL